MTTATAPCLRSRSPRSRRNCASSTFSPVPRSFAEAPPLDRHYMTIASTSIAEALAARIQSLEPQADPAGRKSGERLLLDVAGLCVAARDAAYVRAALD